MHSTYATLLILLVVLDKGLRYSKGIARILLHKTKMLILNEDDQKISGPASDLGARSLERLVAPSAYQAALLTPDQIGDKEKMLYNL